MEIIQNAFENTLSDHIKTLNLDAAQTEELIARLPKTIDGIVSHSADVILETLSRDAPRMLKQRRSEISRFEKRNQLRWKPGIDLLEEFLVITYEVGADFNDSFRQLASTEQDHVFDILTKLHARSCQVGYEVLLLIKNGFADAAHARWRTLHENAVVAFVIAKHGQDLDERYSLHEVIESYKAMVEYQANTHTLHLEEISVEELEKTKIARDTLIKRFGLKFTRQYGWAAGITSNFSFSDLEIEAGLAHLRPYYRMASHNIHANVKGVNFKLGVAPHAEPLLLAGPSNYGFTDPAHGTAISLLQVTSALLLTRPNLDRLVAIKILEKLEEKIGDEFLTIQKKIESEVKS